MSRQHTSAKSHGSPYLRAAILFGIAVGILLTVGVLVLDLPFYPTWIVALSIVTFVAYGYDKRQAQRGGFRTPEIVLHVLALAGGFPGGWAGRAVFHHKTRHRSFLIVLIVATLLHAAIAYWLYLA